MACLQHAWPTLTLDQLRRPRPPLHQLSCHAGRRHRACRHSVPALMRDAGTLPVSRTYSHERSPSVLRPRQFAALSHFNLDCIFGPCTYPTC